MSFRDAVCGYARAPLAALLVAAGCCAPVAKAFVAGFDIPSQAEFGSYTQIDPIFGGSPYVMATPLALTTDTLFPVTLSNHFYASQWGVAIDPTKFYTTSITVAPGKQLQFGDLTYSVEDTGPTLIANSTFHVRSSLDSFTADLDRFALDNDEGLVVDRITDLSGLGVVTGTVEFRFYATTETPNIDMGFANHLPGGAGEGLPDVGQNIRFDGVVSDIPEPGGLPLGLAGLWWNRRMRRHR